MKELKNLIDLLPLSFGVKYRKVKNILRIETDTFQMCVSKEIKVRKGLFREEVWVVHRTADSFDMRRLE